MITLRILLGFALCLVLFPFGLFLSFIGLFVIPLGLLFVDTTPPPTAVEFRDPRFRRPGGVWWLLQLPSVLKLWNNMFDGALGDGRGYWDNYCRTTYGRIRRLIGKLLAYLDSKGYVLSVPRLRKWAAQQVTCTHFYAMWHWLAIRNSTNYWSRVVTGVDVSKCTLVKIFGDDVVSQEPGKREWQFVIAKHPSGFIFPMLFICFAYKKNPNRAIMIKFGWKLWNWQEKVEPTAPIKDRIKGSVLTPSPWKAL